MILHNHPSLNRFSQIVVLVMLSISMVSLTEKKTLAVPLEPILDRIGRQMIEGVFSVDSDTQAIPSTTQLHTNEQQETDSSTETNEQQETDSSIDTNKQQETDSSTDTKEETGSSPLSPTYVLPTYPPSYPPMYPQAYPPMYPQTYLPMYPQAYSPIYPPMYPQAYPSPTYVPPAYQPPNYSFPAPSTGRSNTPVIINNF